MNSYAVCIQHVRNYVGYATQIRCHVPAYVSVCTRESLWHRNDGLPTHTRQEHSVD